MDDERFREIISRFRDPRPSRTKANAFYCFCPHHKNGQERNRSLKIWINLRGNVSLRCYVCQTRDEERAILARVGLRMKDLFADNDDRPIDESKRPVRVETYTYEDEQYRPLFQVWRYEPKSFAQMRYDETTNTYRPGLADCRRVIYRLPDMLACSNDIPVSIVEGERKANLIWSWGLPATCNAGGAGMGWKDDYSLCLRGRHILIVPDNDVSGFRHADQIAGSLLRIGVPSLRFLFLPNLPDKGDVCDWAKAGGDSRQFLELAAKAKVWH